MSHSIDLSVPAAMPNEAALTKPRDQIFKVAEAMIQVSQPVCRIARFEGEKAPTLAEIGRLYVFVREAESALAEVTDYLATVRDSLYDLDYVRIHDNVDPDPEPTKEELAELLAEARGECA